MNFTPGFKRFCTLVSISVILAVAGYFAQIKNYWGLLDKKPEPVAVEQQTPVMEETTAPQAKLPAEVLPAPRVTLSHPVQSVTREPVAEIQPESESAPQPASNAAINKMKSMGKL